MEVKENKHNSVSSTTYFRAFPTTLSLNSTFTEVGGEVLPPVALENVTLFSGQTRWLYLDLGNLPEYTAKISILLGSLDAECASQRQTRQ